MNLFTLSGPSLVGRLAPFCCVTALDGEGETILTSLLYYIQHLNTSQRHLVRD
jgi:hypothetical protein